MALFPGTRIGTYEVLAKLGEGGMGEVYRARDTKLGRGVALEILPDPFASDPDRLARFEREARTLAALNHPHIAQIYGFEARALVLELVEGEDLSTRIARGPIPFDEALAIAREIAEAVDKRSDIWAFGCVLYEMVTAQRPFDGEDITDTIAAVVSKEPDWSRVRAPLTRLLQRCLQKDPRRRRRDIGDAWSLIDDGPRAASAMPASRGWTTGVLAGVAVLAMVVAGAIAYVHFGETGPAPPPVTRLHMALPAGATPDLNMQISPDGRRLAYLGRGADGVVRAYLRAFDEFDASPVAGTEGAGSGSLFWSPDSRWLAFMNQQRLEKFASSRRSSQTIADVSGAPVIGGAWNRDGGDRVRQQSWFGPAGLRRSVQGFRGRRIITPIISLDAERKEMGHRFPTFLPDGRRFLYLRASLTPEQSAIFVGDIDSTPERQPSQPIVTTPAGPAVFFPAAGRESATAGQLLFFRANALMLQPFDLATLQLSGEPRNVAEPVGTFLDRGVFSVSPTALIPPPSAPSTSSYAGTTRPTRRPANRPARLALTPISPFRQTAHEPSSRSASWALDAALPLVAGLRA